MAIALPLIARTVSLLAAAAWLAPAHAEVVTSKLRVSAEVVVSCRLAASVPRVGTPNRSAGTASFSVTCTRGAIALASACGTAACAPVPLGDGRRMEYRVAEPREDGATVATVLF